MWCLKDKNSQQSKEIVKCVSSWKEFAFGLATTRNPSAVGYIMKLEKDLQVGSSKALLYVVGMVVPESSVDQGRSWLLTIM